MRIKQLQLTLGKFCDVINACTVGIKDNSNILWNLLLYMATNDSTDKNKVIYGKLSTNSLICCLGMLDYQIL